MENKLQIVETPDYTLAVSEEEIKEGDLFLLGNYPQKANSYAKKDEIGILNWKEVIKEYSCKKIIAYQPKNNAPELDLPLLPEMVVEEGVEKLAERYVDRRFTVNPDTIFTFERLHRETFVAGYKSATKVYSEEDLREAIELSRVTYKDKSFGQTLFKYKPGEIIQLTRELKNTKTPKWFVAEKELKIIKHIPWDKELESKEEYEKGYPITEYVLKTKIIEGKTYLVGKYK